MVQYTVHPFTKLSQSTVPHNLAPPKPTKGCFRVEPDDLADDKLLESGVATLFPERLGVRDSEGKIISGGLFAVDHKAASDRMCACGVVAILNRNVVSRCGAVRILCTKWAGVVARWPFWIVTWSPVVARCEFCEQSGLRSLQGDLVTKI